jgi:hypothetical protein
MEGFSDLVKEVWESHVTGRTPIQNWNNKLRATRRFLGGWARHLFGRLKNEKLSLSSTIDNLEAIVQ